MKKRNYLGTFVYYYNILNYVISDMLSQWDLAIDAKITFGKNILGHNDKKRLRRDSLWVANNHSIAIIGVLSAPIALLFMVLVSLFLGHKIMACYIVLILFCLSLYIMSISKYDHCYFEYFESIRDINIKKWRYQCLMFAIADMIGGGGSCMCFNSYMSPHKNLGSIFTGTPIVRLWNWSQLLSGKDCDLWTRVRNF